MSEPVIVEDNDEFDEALQVGETVQIVEKHEEII